MVERQPLVANAADPQSSKNFYQMERQSQRALHTGGFTAARHRSTMIYFSSIARVSIGDPFLPERVGFSFYFLLKLLEKSLTKAIMR